MMKRGTHEHNNDKLSDLPDCVLIQILSFLSIKTAVETCLLSRRWKHLWRGLQTLSFTDRPFRSFKHFTEFTNQVLSLHDPSIALIAFSFQTMLSVEPDLLETIETFAASRNKNLKRLSLFYHRIKRIPNFLFSCHSLECLKLKCRYIDHLVFPDSLNLPALTYLKLNGLVFRNGDDGGAEPFSGFNKLNNLIIKHCRPPEKDGQTTLFISNVMLVDLVIDTRYRFLNIQLSAPSLCNFTFNADTYQEISGSSLSCVKHASIDGYVTSSYEAGVMLIWLLIDLVNLESLTISANTLQALYKISNSNLLNSKYTSWSNLKSLQVTLSQDKEYLREQILTMMSRRHVIHEVACGKPWKENLKLQKAIKALEPYAYIPDGAIDFFIQNSPSATVDILIPKQPKGYYFL